MGVSKVVLNDEVKLDLTADTVTADTLAEGITAHGADGEAITGTLIPAGTGAYVWRKYKINYGSSSDMKTSEPSGWPTSGTHYSTSEITEEGYFLLSGTPAGTDNGYYLLPTDAVNGATKTCLRYNVSKTGSFSLTTYTTYTITEEKGDLFGYVSADDESAYPDDGTQDGYWYVRVTEGTETTLTSLVIEPDTSVKTYKPSDYGYDAFSDVTVNKIPSTYIVPDGTLSITENGTFDVSKYASAEVNVASSGGLALPDTIAAGDTPVLANFTGALVSATTATATGCKLTIPTAGTYRCYVFANGGNGYSSGGSIQLYQNGSNVGSNAVSFGPTAPYSFDVTCAAGDEIEVYGTATSSGWSSSNVYVQGLIAAIDWDNGF